VGEAGGGRAPSPTPRAGLLFVAPRLTPAPRNCRGKCRISASSGTRLGGKSKVTTGGWRWHPDPDPVPVEATHPRTSRRRSAARRPPGRPPAAPVRRRSGAGTGTAPGTCETRRRVATDPPLPPHRDAPRPTYGVHWISEPLEDGEGSAWVPVGAPGAASCRGERVGAALQGSTHDLSGDGGHRGGLSPAQGAKPGAGVPGDGRWGLERGSGCRRGAASGRGR